jgi:hypothetical protein
MNYQQLQVLVLRLVAAVEMLAFGAVLMPSSWMASMYGSLGVGEMPSGPIFDAVMRQASMTYGMHGVGLWIIATDVVRYRPLVIAMGICSVMACPVFIAIDLLNRLPWTWLIGNGGSLLLIGTIVLGLLAAEGRAGENTTETSPQNAVTPPG